MLICEERNIGDWDDACWSDLYEFLRQELETSNELGMGSGSELVKPPPYNDSSKWFLDFYWYCRRWVNPEYNMAYTIYLQIEQGRLCFKIDVEWDEDRERRQAVKRSIIERMKEIWPEAVPEDIGWAGDTMAFGEIKREDWLGRDDERIDTNEVLKRLHSYEDFLEEHFVVR